MKLGPTISIDPVLDGVIRLGWFCLDGVDPVATPPTFETDLERLRTHLRGEYTVPADAAPRNRLARVLYRTVGIDPTKNRPSSEALLRRVLTGKPLFRVNSVVDAANFCSLEAALPVGLYDLDRMEGDVRAGLGTAGDGYPGISKGRINLEGKLALFDRKGPFGNPSADSFRTRIREESRRILFIYFAPAELSGEDLERVTLEACSRMAAWTGGREAGRGMVPVRG